MVVNNYPGGQNGLAALNGSFDTFGVLGHFFSRGKEKLTESAVNRLPDGTWMANGGRSKPVFEKFGSQYYLGWQESTRVGGVSRSVFNIDVSRDGVKWTRKYRFE